MNYVNYETAIVQTHKVRLANWPTGLKFVNLSFIGTVGDIQTLHNSLRTGECHWEKLTRLQQIAHKLDLERRQEAGEIVGKPQKQRSDAGTKRKQGGSLQGGRGAAPAQRGHGGVPGQSAMSREIVESSGDE
ncbi:hypothetical protein SERLA73DRAFT_149302 [Serpula lacrymans var. lacrymans S7.3]|uniref:Uncharacterized protein n=1 Tax=Serpula lacrymans var. lacrymans (strain S7.3) TaxID=936435 RepID=F8PHM3_SERL3|nr:hypothetical protein SERLA73DRAFT_149302 [Serpula lacrymans var. lacrymans S7.3]